MDFLEMVLKVLLGWVLASVLAACAWSRFMSHVRGAEEERLLGCASERDPREAA